RRGGGRVEARSAAAGRARADGEAQAAERGLGRREGDGGGETLPRAARYERAARSRHQLRAGRRGCTHAEQRRHRHDHGRRRTVHVRSVLACEVRKDHPGAAPQSMILPRMPSCTTVWLVVLSEATQTVCKTPMTKRRSAVAGTECTSTKLESASPKATAQPPAARSVRGRSPAAERRSPPATGPAPT